jgi:hypothetical protein
MEELKIIVSLLDGVIEKTKLTVVQHNTLSIDEIYRLEETLIQTLTAKLKILEIIKGRE